MEFRMELPKILGDATTSTTHGLIELCPDEYDMGKIGEMLASALAECEELALGAVGTVSETDSL